MFNFFFLKKKQYSLLHDIAEENFPDAKQDDIMKIVSYFVYYRFFNLGKKN